MRTGEEEEEAGAEKEKKIMAGKERIGETRQEWNRAVSFIRNWWRVYRLLPRVIKMEMVTGKGLVRV